MWQLSGGPPRSDRQNMDINTHADIDVQMQKLVTVVVFMGVGKNCSGCSRNGYCDWTRTQKSGGSSAL